MGTEAEPRADHCRLRNNVPCKGPALSEIYVALRPHQSGGVRASGLRDYDSLNGVRVEMTASHFNAIHF
jgi:hypothetical protein